MAKLQKQIEAAVRRRAKQERPQAAEIVKLDVTWGQRDAFTQSHATVLLAVESTLVQVSQQDPEVDDAVVEQALRSHPVSPCCGPRRRSARASPQVPSPRVHGIDTWRGGGHLANGPAGHLHVGEELQRLPGWRSELPGLCRKLRAPRPRLGVAPLHRLTNVGEKTGEREHKRRRWRRPPATTWGGSDKP